MANVIYCTASVNSQATAICNCNGRFVCFIGQGLSIEVQMNFVCNFNACCNVCIQFDIAACFNSCFQFVCIIYNGWLFLCSRFCRFGQIQCLYHFAYRSIRRGVGRTVFKEEFQIQQVVELCFFYQQFFLFGQRVVGCSGCLHLCQQSVCVGVLGQAVKQRQTV